MHSINFSARPREYLINNVSLARTYDLFALYARVMFAGCEMKYVSREQILARMYVAYSNILRIHNDASNYLPKSAR